MQWLQEYYFMYVGTLCDASKQIFLLNIVCSYCKNTVFCMLRPFLMNQNEFCLEVTNAVIARILFSACWDILWWIKTNLVLSWEVLYAVIARILFSVCWDILWWIKTNLVLRWQMQWLHWFKKQQIKLFISCNILWVLAIFISIVIVSCIF